MSITEKEELIIGIGGKTHLFDKEFVKKALKAQLVEENMNKSFCANYERDNKEENTTRDKIVDKVIESFRQRSKFGQEKYNTTLENNNLGLKQWCQHIQEELMDAVNYLEKLKSLL